MFLLMVAAAALLAGLDSYLSYSRLKTYGPMVELNLVARQIGRDYGYKAAAGFIMAFNAGILALLCTFHADTLLHIFLGAKLGLAAMQLKSLELEHFIEKLLAKR